MSVEFFLILGNQGLSFKCLFEFLDSKKSILLNQGVLVLSERTTTLLHQELSFAKQASYSTNEKREVLNSFVNLGIDQILRSNKIDFPEIRKVILCGSELICDKKRTFRNNGPFFHTHANIANYTSFMSPDYFRVFTAIRSFATFVPEIYCASVKEQTMNRFSDFLEGVNLEELSWLPMCKKLIRPFGSVESGDCPVYVWKFEDWRELWTGIIQDLCGISELSTTYFDNNSNEFSCSLKAADAFSEYELRQQFSPVERKHRLEIFESGYPINSDPIEHPFWSEEIQNALENKYHEQCREISDMRKVLFLTSS
ncbi:MAG: hypothetical protein AAF429_04125 [Pseudomonadota bacterium]